MRLKEFQKRALEEVQKYLGLLPSWKKKAEANPDLEIDFPLKAWEKAEIGRAYHSRKNGCKQPLPHFCLKIPTGGGKTLLAVKTIDLVNMVYRKRMNGMVLWIVPSNQIYRQTLAALRDRDHPYRQHLDIASGGRTLIFEKTDRLTPGDVSQNLAVLLLMLPSANRQTKETLRLFKDSGGFQEFFPSDDDPRAHQELLKRFPNLDTFEKEDDFWGRQIKTSLGNTLRTLSPIIILDEGQKAYSDMAQQTLEGFNPCMIVELSATPDSKKSNILVNISGQELLKEGMIKLDLHITNKASPDWKNTLLDGMRQRDLLEKKARIHENNSGTHIRPICLIQVERTGKDQRGSRWIHSEEVREHLTKVMGIPEDQVAVKTSEKDELKEVDDVGGLMSRNCNVRYIITKQALQEGWDCAFAYVLVILTNPASQNALTQLVGRILRQPLARKTGIQELDESYVFCFQKKASELLNDIREGFDDEGLGDLKDLIRREGTGNEDEDREKMVEIQMKFREAARRTLLPVFMIRDGNHWRPVGYETDVVPRISWNEIQLEKVKNMTLSMNQDEREDVGLTTTIDDGGDGLKTKQERRKEGEIQVDPIFMTRQINDLVPNPWLAWEMAVETLEHHRKTCKSNEKLLEANFVFLIEELRKCVGMEKERLAEAVFRELLKKDMLRFLIISKDLNFSFPEKVKVVPKLQPPLRRRDHESIQLGLFDYIPETDFNETEKAVAWYLEGQHRLFFWYRNKSRKDYAIQGWREHRIYPDFVFTTTDKKTGKDYEKVFVIETKGLHLKDNDKTQYIRKVFDMCTEQAKSRYRDELGLEMKDKVLKFEVLAEDEWQTKLNEMLKD